MSMMLAQHHGGLMATQPTALRASAHHGYKSWTSTWYDDQKRRRTKRFGRVDDVTRREANARYLRWMAEWKDKRHIQNPGDPSSYNVSHLCVAYLEHCRTIYVKRGKPTSHHWQFEAAMDWLTRELGSRPVNSIEAPDIVKLRDAMIDTTDRYGDTRPLALSTINGRLRIIKQAFAWARMYGLVDKATAYDVSLVPGLRAGRSRAVAAKKILPVPQEVLDATLAVATPTIAAMIRLQLITGMRSGEMCDMRVCDLVKDGEDVVYRPIHHKTEHHEKDRVIVLGPRAQEIIRPFVDRRVKISEYVFLPSEAHRELLEMRGKPKVMAYQMSRSNFKPGRCYITMTYYGQVERTCDRAFDANGLKRKRRDFSHRWHPHQLRHNTATRLREEFGIEAANDALGHDSFNTTGIYAERSLKRQKEIARKVG
jgi:integrase